jgi:hypothetical protein
MTQGVADHFESLMASRRRAAATSSLLVRAQHDRMWSKKDIVSAYTMNIATTGPAHGNATASQQKAMRRPRWHTEAPM